MAEKTTYVIELNDKLSPGLKKATAKALGLDKAIGGVGKKAKKGAGGVSALGASLKGLVGPLALAAAGMKAFQIASESIQAARNFESLTNAINFTSGSVEEGAKTMDYLRQRAELMGTDLLVSVEGFKTLSTAMLGTKLEGEATRSIFDGIQVATTAMGLSAENSKGAIIAIGQMMSKGKVSAEELTQQLNERLPGSLGAASRAMGVTTKELFKMMEQGQLMSEDFLPKFSNELKKTFGKALPTAAESSQAQFNRFNNSMLELKLTLGNKLMPVVNGFMSGIKRVFALIKTNAGVLAQVFAPVINVFTELGDIVSSFFSRLTGGVSITESLQIVFAGLQRVIQFLQPVWKGLLSVLGAVFDVIIKVKDAFLIFLDRFPIISKTFWGFVSSIRSGFLAILDSAKTILGGVGDLLAGIFTGNVE
jgi:tape measure domain-containing protein